MVESESHPPGCVSLPVWDYCFALIAIPVNPQRIWKGQGKDAMVTGVIKTKFQIYKKAINCLLELKKSNANAAVHAMTLIRMSLRQVVQHKIFICINSYVSFICIIFSTQEKTN